jgi:hypothetical protein
MALFTSTPKSKAGEKVSLLALDCSDDDNSSGYDSPTVIRELLLMSAWVLNQLGLINVVSFTSHSLEGNKSLFKINNT